MSAVDCVGSGVDARGDCRVGEVLAALVMTVLVAPVLALVLLVESAVACVGDGPGGG